MVNDRKLTSYIQLAIVIVLFIGFATACTQNEKGNDPLNSRINGLVAQMTLNEKLGQLSQRFVEDIDQELLDDIKAGKVGSVLNGGTNFVSPEERNRIQQAAVEGSRLGIPIIFGHDVIHGFRTIFPTSLAQSCSWNPELVRKAASIAALESSASGVDWTFAPMVDVSRDPRWGRIAESYGEDTYLNSVLGAAAVKGFQGEDLTDERSVVACMKHFVGYGVAMGGRDYQYTDISERSMHEVYLPSFKAGVEAGALTVMSSFNDINGVPSSANKKYLRETLKEKWGFEGFVVSDWDAVSELILHGYAADSVSAAVRALEGGVDMEMKTLTYRKLKGLVENGQFPESIIDEAVKRILFVKMKKGLFQNPYVDTTRMSRELLTKESREFARKAGRESMVLLKNEKHVLPLTEKIKSVAVLGPFAEESELMGWWKSTGKTSDVITPLDGLKANAPHGLQVTTKVTNATDVVIVCLGEPYNMFGENHSRSDIQLYKDQEELLKKLAKSGKPVITVIFNGRPLDLSNVVPVSDVVLLAWHPGTEAGNSLADVLYGKYNPAGRLTTSFPKSVGQLPVFYNHRSSGRPQSNDYEDLNAQPLFPFGYGLSYSSFKYDALHLSAKTLYTNDSLVIQAKITNESELAGEEVVQLYIRDLVGSTTRPVKELKGFKKIWLDAGESKLVSFILKPEELCVLDENFEPKLEAGEFQLWLGPNSKEGLQGALELETTPKN
ncbi:glycoside hydrolase family 3 N-terminal domain-containing protein [uncultured Draconibacterium sp.]|uniref:glycoside hydrolase family 3 N-terminal domain-containing protein n=1 Tax=uncultured Draconibacterium sp. TaxID=1573823 RepID=UPI0025F71C45|nr:glycoside hydrolase family 3 N-terminal domain-containing protein [uncultured Draconibacterium sp.]